MNMKKIKTALKRFSHRIPSKLPTGGAEFDAFSLSILDTHGIPNLPSYRNAIATMIMHLGPTTDKAPKMHFVKSIRKAMANQTAYEKMQAIKEETKKLEATEPMDGSHEPPNTDQEAPSAVV